MRLARLGAVFGRDHDVEEQAFERDPGFGGSRVVPEVVEFVWVVCQVVELASTGAGGGRRAVLDDELVVAVAQHREVHGWVIGVAAVAVLAEGPATGWRAGVA